MSDQNTADNWRLEDTGKTGKQWKLQETEQNRIAQWELQDESYEDTNWQPVLYEREPRQQGGGWVLPSLVGLALIAVVAYGAWIGLTQFTPGAFNLGNLISAATFTPAPANTGNDPNAVAGIGTEAATTEVPTAAPATPTPEPTATLPAAPTATAAPAIVELTYARITNQYGVNARREPSTDAEVIELLDQGETYLLQQTQAEWLQIALSDGTLAWISADFAEQFTQQKPLAEANSELAAVGLPPLAGPPAEASAPEVPVNSEPGTAPISTTTPITSPVVTTPVTPTDTLATVSITGTVNITAGLNARSEPSADAALVTLLPGNTVLTLTGRTADSSWFSTIVSDSVSAWVFAEYITVSGDINGLPVDGVTAPITGTLLTTDTTPLATTPPLTTTTAPTGTTATAPTGATATVNTILGAGVRQGPSRDADAIGTLPFDRVYSVLARSADDQWVQIALEANQQGWVLVSSVTLNVDLATLPVVVP